MHKSNTTVPTETYSTPDTFKHTSSIHTQASKFTQAWTHTHTQSNQWCQDRHLTPADIPPQDGRRFFTAVTLSNRQEETEEDGQAGLEKNQVCCTEWERNAKTSSQDKKRKMTGTTTVCDFLRAVKSCLLFDVLMLNRDALKQQLAS